MTEVTGKHHRVIFRDHLSTSGTDDFLMECAIEPSDQMVNATNYSQEKQGLRHY